MSRRNDDLIRTHLQHGSRTKQKVVLALGVLYILCPIDLLPDVIPVVGWLDDLGVLAYVAKLAFDLYREADEKRVHPESSHQAETALRAPPAIGENVREHAAKDRPTVRTLIVCLVVVLLLAAAAGAGLTSLWSSAPGQ